MKPTSNQTHARFIFLTFEKIKKIQFKSIIVFGIISCLMIYSCSNNESNTSNNNSPEQEYIAQQAEIVKNLPAKKQQIRKKSLNELQNNPLYEKYSTEISAQYLPVLDALGEAIKSRDDSTFYLSVATENQLNKEQKDVVFNQMRLLFAGGFTEEMLKKFDEYKDKFGYYGFAGSTGYNDNGKVTDSIVANYNLTPIFVVFEPNDKKLANSIYEVESKGIENWEDVTNRNFTYPYLHNKRDFNNYLKQVDPESPYILNYDYELSASELFNIYNANEVAADKKYKGKKILITGTVISINKDVLGNSYALLQTNDLMADVHCTIKNEDEAATLQKDNQYTFLGTCGGMVLTSVLLDDCIKVNN